MDGEKVTGITHKTKTTQPPMYNKYVAQQTPDGYTVWGPPGMFEGFKKGDSHKGGPPAMSQNLVKGYKGEPSQFPQKGGGRGKGKGSNWTPSNNFQKNDANSSFQAPPLQSSKSYSSLQDLANDNPRPATPPKNGSGGRGRGSYV